MKKKMRNEVDEKEKCCTFTQGSRAAIRSQPLSKLNALGVRRMESSNYSGDK